MWKLHRYEATPGPSAASPQKWPTPSQITLDKNRHTLVMFVHPRCPCSAASIEQLDKIVARCGDRVSSYVLAVIPDGAPLGFLEKSRTIKAAAAIPGVRVLTDPGEREASRFGAETSGHVLLYGRDGRLEFSGGITESRGHAGDNAACEAVVALINGDVPTAKLVDRSSVYGCSLSGGLGKK
jgi:hypothetical protein